MKLLSMCAVAALLIPATITAQSVELVQRSRSGDAPTQNDAAVRLYVPHMMVEGGSLRTQGIHDVWLYVVGDIKVKKTTVVGEAFVAPSSDYVSRQSLGGSVAYEITSALVSTNRYIFYKNPDESKQHLYTTGLDYTAHSVTLGGSVGGLTGKNTIGQARVKANSGPVSVLLYASNWMEVPDMPWGTWVVKEMGVVNKVTLNKSVGFLFGLSVGEDDSKNNYSSVSLGLRYNF